MVQLVGLFVNTYLYILWFKQVIDGKALHNTSTKKTMRHWKKRQEEKVEFLISCTLVRFLEMLFMSIHKPLPPPLPPPPYGPPPPPGYPPLPYPPPLWL